MSQDGQAWVAWFERHLTSSVDGVVWAFQRIPAARHWQYPPAPGYLGIWPPARHLWHLAGYEQTIVLPSMQQWLGGPLPDGAAWHDDDASWGQQPRDAEALIAALTAVRARQVVLLSALHAVDWDVPRLTLWGMQPLAMVVTKTYQHTFEHGDTLLRMGLWWDHRAAAEADERAAGADS